MIEHSNRAYEEQYKKLFYSSLQGIAVHEIIYDGNNKAVNYRILDVNPAFEKIIGIPKELVVGKLSTDAYKTKEPPYFSVYRKVCTNSSKETFEVYFEPLHKHFKIFAYSSGEDEFVTVFTDITTEKTALKHLEESNQNEKQHAKELDFLLKASRGLLEHTDFAITSRKIFDYACEVTGAFSGYVALLNEDGSENELVFLEAGGMDCTVDPTLPMPIRGLRGEAYRDGKPVFHNDFMNSKWFEWMPSGHCYLRNVLFAPLNVDGKTIGIMGLANKPSDFTEEDARICEAFGDLAALALQKSKNVQALSNSEKQFRETIEQAYDGILITNDKFDIIEWNQSQTRIFGFTSREMMGTPLWDFQCNILEDANNQAVDCEEIKERIINHKNNAAAPEIWEVQIKTKTGVFRDVQFTAFPIHFSDGFLFCLIARDITEEKRLMKLKDRFVSVVTHELRTPLLSIKSSIQLLGEQALGSLNEQQSELVSICNRNTDRLSKFINEVLDYQSLAQKNNKEVFTKEDVCSVLQETYDSLKPLAQQKHLSFSVQCDPAHLPKVEMNRNQIVRLFINVANNAIKYTNSGSVEITVVPFPVRNCLRVVVKDTGIGIKQEDIDSLFKSFVMLHDSKEKSQHSTGLGLSIAKRTVELHHGRIWAESEYGKGSSFFIELPIEQEQGTKK